MKYALEANEGIVLQYDGVYHNKKKAEIVLTNRNFVCIEKLKGRNNYNVIKYPISQIKVIDGQAKVSVIKDDGDYVLQVQFKTGTEQFSFVCDLFERIKIKQVVNKWTQEISVLLTGQIPENDEENAFVGAVKSTLNSFGVNTKSRESENITKKCIGCMAPITGKKGQTVRCKYCDTNQTL